jgi:hypothetical protein
MTKTPDVPSTSYDPYKTSDTPFAAFLHYSGYKLMGSVQDPNDYKREVVIFLYDDKIEPLEAEWRFGKASGDLKRYHRSLKIVNRTINENRKKREE